MASEVSICNQALGWLGANLITSLDDETTEAVLCKANYSHLRDAVLEEADWTFATRRFKLVKSPNEPVYGYANKFQIPNDALRLISATNREDNRNDTDEFDWRREENFILANDAVVYSKIVVRITDPKRFSFMFIQALAYRIAAELATPLTESRTKEEKMQQMYEHRINKAKASDGSQGKSDRIKSNSSILRRR